MEKAITTLTTMLDKGKLFIKGMIIFGMALALWIPTFIIMEVIKERESRQKEAIADISSKWAGKQTFSGPVLVLPYKDSARDNQGNIVTVRKQAYFLPDRNETFSKVFPEKRHRGIYQVAVYKTDLDVKSHFNSIPWQNIKTAPENILWDDALLALSITDNSKGISEDIFVNWGGKKIVFNPQATGQTGFREAFVAKIPITPETAAMENNFQLNFSLNGSEELLFSSLARENHLKMESTWPNPSFSGVKLPDKREVSDKGFSAEWKFMNRSVPQTWENTVYESGDNVMGAVLMIPVDSYNKTERSVKYALLCIILTFASFFLIETIYKRPLHLVQYALAGLALVLFYTLLLSISEYTGFNMGYLLAGVATIGLVSWYVGSIMRSGKLAAFISLVLTVVYSYIFTIIQLQDYALLMGSLGLFMALGIIMYFSRRLQW
jgi:inner membrane protein